jgi:hypothetical protein
MVRVAEHLFKKEPCLLDVAGPGKTLDVPEGAYVERALASPQSVDPRVTSTSISCFESYQLAPSSP